MSNVEILTIAALTKYIKRTFDNDSLLQDVWVRGEISNFKKHSRGHMYFTIKDRESKIQAVMFAGNNRFLSFMPEDGMNVLVRGSVSVYEPHGQYQMYVQEMQLDGVGNLFIAFEQLKKKLEIAGYFSENLKKQLPAIPVEIGVVTSPTGAAVKDIVTTIKRRFPIARITLFPVLVQGEHAPLSIAKAIKQANEIKSLQLLIVGRGGGSIEELWAFNEEIVAEAIFQSNLPIISAVGHETDFTIADFVADIRAATPTAAAEMAVPHMNELLDRLAQRTIRLKRAITEQLGRETRRLTILKKSYAFRYPQQLVRQKEQQLDRLLDQLDKSYHQKIEQKRAELTQLMKDLHRNHPKAQVDKAYERVRRQQQLLKQQTLLVKKDHINQLQQLAGKLDALSPLKIMSRGYSLAYNNDGALVKSISDVSVGESIHIQFQDGYIHCGVKGKNGGANDE